MMGAMRNLVIGAVGLGAAGAGYFGLTSNNPADPANSTQAEVQDEQEASLTASSAPEEICLNSDIDFLPGNQNGCFSRDELDAWMRTPLAQSDRSALAVTMTHPSDASLATVDCSTCREFDELRYEGWYAMTSRDMRRAAFFVRACGVIEMLRNASVSQSDYFGADGLTSGEVMSLSANRLLRIAGDAAALSPGDPEIEQAGPSSWRVAANGQTIFIDELVSLDFDDDGVAEILAFFAAGPDRATARVSDVALIEKDEPDAAPSLTAIDFEALRTARTKS